VRPTIDAASPLLLEVDNLTTYFFTRDGIVRAVDGVSFSVRRGEVLAIVGESGCGKSVTSLSIMRLIASPPGKTVEGRVLFEGRDLLQLSEAEMRNIRGDAISMIFQEPMTSLNPVLTIGRQIAEALVLHRGTSRDEAARRTVELLRLVRMPEAERRASQYPHELSGGMRQRVMIAMALACEPRLLIADEPTTALDVTIQAQILDLMRELQQRTGAAIVLITHDLGVVAEMAERVVVMYAGRKVEEASVGDLFAHPRHPYTRGLLDSIPKLGAGGHGDGERVRLAEIAGTVPSLSEPIVGCAFAPRCAFATPRCRDEFPPLEEKAPAHFAACWESARVTAGSAAASTQSPDPRGAAEWPDANHPDDRSAAAGRDAGDARAAR
jgi:peptide/nickel transport system ATP-binding protein